MKRTDIVNYLNGVWPSLISSYVLKSHPTMQGVNQWQYALGCTFFGLLGFAPQFLFNFLQTGHSWKNDIGEIKRAMIGGMASGCILSFIPVGEWFWQASIFVLVFNLMLWKIGIIIGWFKKH